jgi:hypothetical protein
MPFHFKISHNLESLIQALENQHAIFKESDYDGAMKYAAKPIQEALDRNTPNSQGSYKAARTSRAKFGTLSTKGTNAYLSKGRNRATGVHAINVGYFSRNNQKAFITSFLNYGFRNRYRGFKFYKPSYAGWMQRAEQSSISVAEKRFSDNMNTRFIRGVKRVGLDVQHYKTLMIK